MDSVCGTMPSSGRDLVTVALCCLAAIVEGYDIQSMGVAAPGLAPALHLTRDQLGPAFSASTVGLFIGAIAIGRLADRIGRKWALVGSLAPDVYAVRMRATGLGGVIGLGRIGAILGPLLAGALLVGGRNATGVLLALLPFIGFAALATFVALSRRSRLAALAAATPESEPAPA